MYRNTGSSVQAIAAPARACYAAGVAFNHIRGQATAVATLETALRGNRVHHAYRFEGPDGTGKELAAFALAQALVCSAGDVLGCGRCDACRRAVTFSEERPRSPHHPDVMIIERAFYPPETFTPPKNETQQISIEQIRTIVLAHAAYPAHEGRARVFILRRAEELSIGAANALLKTLEEPRNGTHFILLTARPDRLLNTIRSRTLPVRFAPLPDEVVRSVLRARSIPEERHDLAVELAAGSASLALELVDEERTVARDAFVSEALAAVAAPNLGAAVAFGESREKDKDQLKDDLRALAASLAREARQCVDTAPRQAGVAAKRYEAVAKAVVNLDRNASVPLTMIAMIQDMRETLR
jgi:DNA polymerase-3 subunit delta'